MFQLRFYIILILTCTCVHLSAQNDITDLDVLDMHVKSYITQSSFDSDRGDYYSAKEKLDKALKIVNETGNKKEEGIIYTRIANLQFIIGSSNEAFASLTKATKIQREIEDYENLAITLNSRGLLHFKNKEYQTALEYFNSAKTTFEQEDLEEYLSEISLNKAKVYIQLKDYKSAKSLLERSILIAKKHSQKSILSESLIYSGKVLQHLGNQQLGLSMTYEGLEISKENNYLKNINESYLTLSDIYQSNKNYKQANHFLRKQIKFSDSILKIKHNNTPAETDTLVINEYREAENQHLKAQMEEKNKESNLTKITTILSIALITILSLLTLSLYKNNNIRLKTNNMLHKKNDELIKAKEKAELASKTKANFLSTVTHELRTPLYAVTGLTNMLLDENPKKEQIPHLKSLKFSGDYLLTFINDILQVNKIEAKKVDLDPEIFNLKKKVNNVISALNNSASDNNITMHYEYDDSLPKTFEADQLKISQILINLIGNAIKFTKDGDIWVRVKNTGETNGTFNIRFEIEDNGIGITKEKQEHMFESFSQGSIQINRKYGGTGLGLSIVKGLIEILKGTISLKSELGKGSTFIFEIPLTYSEQIVSTKTIDYSKNISKLNLDNIKILVVEDNKINQMITKKILNKMQLYCDVIDNGEDAVDMVKQNQYDVVLMDIHMPGISGLEATKIIRTFDKDLTIFALTAVTLEDKMHEFDEAGFNDIISKPFKHEDFEKKLYSALENNQKNL